MKRRIFISSTQRDLARERKAIVKAVANDPQLSRFVFVKGLKDTSRDPRQTAFLNRVSPGLVRSRFATIKQLLSSLTTTLDAYLAENKVAYSGLSYEEEPVGKWESLDEEKIRWYVRTARAKRGFPLTDDAPVAKVLEHLRMVTDGVTNRAAMLCFGKDAHLFATSPGVKCLLWYGKERKKPVGSYKWFEGNLFEVSDKAIEFVKEKLNLRIGGHTLGARSDDTFEIDACIVSEMINNAIATNPIIARAPYYVQYIEEIGSGTTDIFEHCAAQGLEPPVFEVDARHVSVTVTRPVFDEKGLRASSECRGCL